MTDLTRKQIEALLKCGSTKHVATTLARQLLVTMTERDEAQAAQAGVVSSAFEAGAKAVHDEWVRAHQAGETPPRGEPDFSEAASDYASLADPTGVKLLAEMQARAEADVRRLIVVATNPSGQKCDACRATGLSHCSDPINCGGMVDYTVEEAIERVGDLLSAWKAARVETIDLRARAEAAEAQLAEAQKREAGLRAMIRVNMLRYGSADLTHEDIDRQIGAALSAAPTGEESNG